MSAMKRSTLASHYHSALRIAVVVTAFLVVFDSGLIDSRTATLADGAVRYVATAVGVKAQVPGNELNVLTSRITELEQELERKDREIAVARNSDVNEEQVAFDVSTFVLSLILFILLVLIVLNYVLDYLRVNRRYETANGT